MAATCENCGRRFGMGHRPVTTLTGRSVCRDCQDTLTAAAAGIIANPAAPVAGAIATSGWFRILRGRRRRGPEPAPKAPAPPVEERSS